MINHLSSKWLLCLALYPLIQPMHCFKLDPNFPSRLKFHYTRPRIPSFHLFWMTVLFVPKILILNPNFMPLLMFFFLPSCICQAKWKWTRTLRPPMKTSPSLHGPLLPARTEIIAPSANRWWHPPYRALCASLRLSSGATPLLASPGPSSVSATP